MNLGENVGTVLSVEDGESVKFDVDFELRDSVAWFASCMETVLQENDHKPGWDEESFGPLFDTLVKKVVELNDHVPTVSGTQDLSLQQIAAIVENSVHIANYAMMIADKAHQRVVINDAGTRTGRIQSIQPNESGGSQ